MKFYSKKKSVQKLGFRGAPTPDHYKQSLTPLRGTKRQAVSAGKPVNQPKFNPTHFRIQHKG